MPPSDPDDVRPVLSFAERVRKRHGMYVDDPEILLLGIVENSLDEAIRGYGTLVVVTLDGGTATVEDQGRGIPIELPTFTGTLAQQESARTFYGDASALELVFTMEPGQGPNRIAQGLGPSLIDGRPWSISASAICALCAELIVETTRAGRRYRARFERGRCIERPRDVGPTPNAGTSITLRPDFELLGKPQTFDAERIAKALRGAAERHSQVEVRFRCAWNTSERYPQPE